MKSIIFGVGMLMITNVAIARDTIHTVGSSTVFPFSTTVAENYGKTTGNKIPIIEATGTGGGFKLFCSGIGVNTPDITNASRAIKETEKKLCAQNGVTPIEVKIGYDGIVIANSKKGFDYTFTRRELFMALAKEVPIDGKMVPNPYLTWNDINPNLPKTKIEILGPPPTSGTRDAFVELIMEEGAKTFPLLKEMDKKKFKQYAHTIREDGAYVEAGENDNLIVQKLTANPAAIGIFGFSFLDQNYDVIQGAAIENIEPSFDAIIEGSYKVSRPLFFYVKKEHLNEIRGLREYILYFIDDKMIGDMGTTTDKGLIPLSVEERNEMKENVMQKLQ